MTNVECTYFDGYKPCKFQKRDTSLKCNNLCKFYENKKRVLILKKGAIGEVLRCTVLFNYLKDYEIHIMTNFPEIINKDSVRHIYQCKPENYLVVQSQKYHLLLSLDKEQDMCALANLIDAEIKKGFKLDINGKIVPFDKDAEHLWNRGIDDDFMKSDKKNYSRLIAECCGFKYNPEYGYIMPEFNKKNWIKKNGKKIVGLNTGSSKAWTTRIWPERMWIELIKMLQKENYEPILLGGPIEDEKNRDISRLTGAKYFGVKPYDEFMSILDNCDVIVTSVTFALHAAIGLNKKVILFNNIFNRYEFELKDVHILEPKIPCLMCYKPQFDKACPVENCMESVSSEEVFEAIKSLK
jgi:heptosyltransferase-2